MKSPTQQQFEREASRLLYYGLWTLGFLVGTAWAFHGFGFLGNDWFLGLVTGLWLSGLIEALMARGILKRFYGVKRPPWRGQK